MPPNSNLEQQLGEINGQLKSLVPALEKLEGRQTEMGKEIAAITANLENATKEIDVLKEKVEQKEKRGWEFFLVIFAGILGAGLTWLVGKVAR